MALEQLAMFVVTCKNSLNIFKANCKCRVHVCVCVSVGVCKSRTSGQDACDNDNDNDNDGRLSAAEPANRRRTNE